MLLDIVFHDVVSVGPGSLPVTHEARTKVIEAGTDFMDVKCGPCLTGPIIPSMRRVDMTELAGCPTSV
jgi:hypothetical protein